MLDQPKFDNGDSSLHGFMAVSLVESIPTNTTPDLLDAFGEELVKRILTPSDHDPEYFEGSNLSVDYNPCPALSESAFAVGLECGFPWKTTMWVYADSISLRHGYGAKTVFHYALGNGKWLVTTLSGSEIELIKKHVTDGSPLEFRVED